MFPSLFECLICWSLEAYLLGACLGNIEQKDEQLRIYRESVDTLESLLDEEKERQTELANGYEEMTKDTRQTLSKVSAVNKQLRVLKTDTSKYQMIGHTNDLEVTSDP